MMKLFKKLLLLFVLLAHTPAPIQAMQEQPLSVAVDAIVDKAKKHLSSIAESGSTSSSALSTAPKLAPNDQGTIIWRDDKSGLEIVAYAPALPSDMVKLEKCVRTYESEQLGWPWAWKPFVAILKNEAGDQLCGATGKLLGDFLFLDSFGQPHPDHALFQNFMHNLEAFATQNAASRMLVMLSEKEASFVKAFSAIGYVVHTQRCALIKELQDKQPTNTSDAFVVRWVSESDYFEKKEQAASAFFSSEIQKCQTEFNPEHQSTIDIGIIIRDKNGTWLGGAIGQLSLTAKIPHIYLQNIWIDPSIRGKGVAKNILSHLEVIAKQLGCVQMRTATTSLLAPWLFEKCGYYVTYTIRCSLQKKGCSDNLYYIFEKDL